MSTFKRNAAVALAAVSMVAASTTALAAATTSSSSTRSSVSSAKRDYSPARTPATAPSAKRDYRASSPSVTSYSFKNQTATPAPRQTTSTAEPAAPSNKKMFGGFSTPSQTKSAQNNAASSGPAPTGSSTQATKKMFGGFSSGSQATGSGTNGVTANQPVAAKPTTPTSAPVSMGRFASGSASTPAAVQAQPLPKTTSALSASLDKSAAQANALKNYERNIAAKKAAIAVGAGAATGAVVATTMQGNEAEKTFNSNEATIAQAPVEQAPTPKQSAKVAKQEQHYEQQAHAPVAQQPRQNSTDNSMLWYMLGQASVKQQPPVTRERAPEREYNVPTEQTSANAAPSITTSTAVPTVAPTQRVQSGGSGGFGIFFLILTIIAIGGCIWFVVSRQKASKAAAAPKRNYSI